MDPVDRYYGNQELIDAIAANQKAAGVPYTPPMNQSNQDLLNVLKGIGNYGKDLYGRIQRGVTQGPYSSPTGEYDPKIGLLGPEVMLPGLGRATAPAELTAGFRSSLGMRGAKSAFTPQMQNTLKNLIVKYENTPGKLKLIAKEFRQIHPEFTSSDAAIERAGSRIRNWGGLNLNTGAKSTNPGSDFELGAFGGRGKLNTPSYGEDMAWLQSQRPVDREFVRQWAKESGVPIKENIHPKGSTYYELSPPSRPTGELPVTVRIPEDLHWGRPVTNKELGLRFDTGIEPPIKSEGFVRQPSKYESGMVNQGGQPYANREALERALELATSESRTPFGTPGGFKLVSPDYAPRGREIGEAFHSPTKPDPNQLKLLSQGFTPYDILEILRQQNGPRQ